MSANEPNIAPHRAMSISEVSAATGVSARRIVSLIEDAILPESVCLKNGKTQALRAYSMPMTVFCEKDSTAIDKRMRNEVLHLAGNFAKENWRRLLDDPEQAESLRFMSGRNEIALGKHVREAMIGLNRLIDARGRVVEDPDMLGGIPTIRGKRISVYQIAGLCENEEVDTVLEHYPSLSRADVEAAALYAKAYPIPPRRQLTDRQRANAYPGARLISKTVMKLSTQA